jgi:hypothetical protein
MQFPKKWNPSWNISWSISSCQSLKLCVDTLSYLCKIFYYASSTYIDWLIIYGFTSRSRIFHLYGDVPITGEGLQNLGLCSALRTFEQEGMLIVPPACCNTGPRFFRSHPKDRLIQSPLMTHKGMWRTNSNQDPHGSPFIRLLRHTRECGGPILTRILTGFFYA